MKTFASEVSFPLLLNFCFLQDDEFVVYETNQVKMKYIVKFSVSGDEIKDFHPCDNTELEEYRPEFSNFSTVEGEMAFLTAVLCDVYKTETLYFQ